MIRRSRWARAVLLVLLVLAVAVTACADEGGGRAAAISCNTAYRISQSEPLTETDTLRLEDRESSGSIPYIYLEFHAEYRDGATDADRALRVWVTPTAADEVLASQLLQLPSDEGPVDQFVGGHGFTGLVSVLDPVSGAELQYWCERG